MLKSFESDWKRRHDSLQWQLTEMEQQMVSSLPVWNCFDGKNKLKCPKFAVSKFLLFQQKKNLMTANLI